ncbi:MAG: radical SAM protein [Desulfobacterales bacterium]|nr:radical SAM protein [Desulfobacterales bacterium]
MVLIHPPVVKPSEPPAGIARLAGALRDHGVGCTLIDANLEGLRYLLARVQPGADTWSQRAYRHLDRHLKSLCSPEVYDRPDTYRRAVADVERLLGQCGPEGVRPGLADYRDGRWSPVRSADLRAAAHQPERNPFHGYYMEGLLPRLAAVSPSVVGISINYLSQALCAFALIGVLKRERPGLKIILGGGLITSWMQRPGRIDRLADLVDQVAAGPGEAILLQAAGRHLSHGDGAPDYSQLRELPYLSPGFILPFSASAGCWWRRCAFCPERAEKRPFQPLPHRLAAAQLRQLTEQTRPVLIHLLDNALSPGLLQALCRQPPGAPWYGFVRIAAPLDDPDFCLQLAAAGCRMLKIGLESGNQAVLDRLDKGVRLEMASRVLANLRRAGIAAYVYLLFGTPAEDQAAARDTLAFVAEHAAAIDFLNLAIFNLPLGSPDAAGLALRDFYDGDLALYRDFEHPSGWDRAKARRFVERVFKKHPLVQPIVRRDPPLFTSNHAAFFIPPAR